MHEGSTSEARASKVRGYFFSFCRAGPFCLRCLSPKRSSERETLFSCFFFHSVDCFCTPSSSTSLGIIYLVQGRYYLPGMVLVYINTGIAHRCLFSLYRTDRNIYLVYGTPEYVYCIYMCCVVFWVYYIFHRTMFA